MRSQTFVAGIFEHPTRKADGATVAQLHAEVALGALADAGLTLSDVDGYFCGADAPGLGVATMAEYIGLDRLRYVDGTESGGSSYLLHVNHAARAIAEGKCDVALITMADTPLASKGGLMLSGVDRSKLPALPYSVAVPALPMYGYGMVARRHMHEFGTTPEQLAWVKVAASQHAQYNPNAKLQNVVTVEEVLASPMVADPLHRLDCCVVTDGGGALVLVREEIARTLSRPLVRLAGAGEAVKHSSGGTYEFTSSAGVRSGADAFAEAGITPMDIHYASLYDSFTITVIVQLEDLGFCARGQGGVFASNGNLVSGVGRLAVNTDGGGLCNNHPGNKGGIPKLVEAVRQSRGEAHPDVQVPNHEFTLAHATGAMMSSYHVAGTTIFQAV
jgi:acetyl-CoA C-acetyltransferase